MPPILNPEGNTRPWLRPSAKYNCPMLFSAIFISRG